jgi:hypothetical protein
MFWDSKPVNDIRRTSFSSTFFGIALLLRRDSVAQFTLAVNSPATRAGRTAESTHTPEAAEAAARVGVRTWGGIPAVAAVASLG